MSKLLEDVVLSLAVVLGYLITLYLAYALVVQGAQYPPTLIVAFLAIATAALIYRFMGGLGGTEFQAGLLKLGGAAAFFVGTIWFVGDRFREELNLYASSEPFQAQIGALEKRQEHLQAINRRQASDLEKLRTDGPNGSCPTGQCSLPGIKKMKPGDPLVQDIRRLVEGQEWPFISTLRELPVKIAVVGGLGDSPAFNICRDTLEKLNQGVEVPNPTVQLSRTLGDGATASLHAERAGRIGEDVCSSPQRDFDVQINCPAALKLFADKISGCAEGAIVRGATVAISSLAE